MGAEGGRQKFTALPLHVGKGKSVGFLPPFRHDGFPSHHQNLPQSFHSWSLTQRFTHPRLRKPKEKNTKEKKEKEVEVENRKDKLKKKKKLYPDTSDSLSSCLKLFWKVVKFMTHSIEKRLTTCK